MIKNKQQIVRGKIVLPNTITMTCKQCGSKQTYSNKYSYRRAMGIAGLGKSDKKENSGLCGKCRRSAKRKPGAGQYDRSHLKVERGDWHRYRKSSMERAATQLKIHNPKEYERYINNKWDNVDLDKLCIDHIKEVRECYDEGLSLTECCDISNLQVITMRENISKSNPKAKFKT